MKRLVEIQELLMSKLHPAFVKGAISIAIGVLTFWTMTLDNPEITEMLTKPVLTVIKLTIGTLAVALNQFRDALSAYYTEKNKPVVNTENPTDNSKPV